LGQDEIKYITTFVRELFLHYSFRVSRLGSFVASSLNVLLVL
jgi:hypothetical protein